MHSGLGDITEMAGWCYHSEHEGAIPGGWSKLPDNQTDNQRSLAEGGGAREWEQQLQVSNSNSIRTGHSHG